MTILDTGDIFIGFCLLLGTLLVVLPSTWRNLIVKMVDYMQLYQMRQMQAKLCEPLYDAIEDCDFKKGIKLFTQTLHESEKLKDKDLSHNDE